MYVNASVEISLIYMRVCDYFRLNPLYNDSWTCQSNIGILYVYIKYIQFLSNTEDSMEFVVNKLYLSGPIAIVNSFTDYFKIVGNSLANHIAM